MHPCTVFSVQAWARDLFAEEVVRGGPAFAVSLVITSIEASLRNAAALGAWQVGDQSATSKAGGPTETALVIDSCISLQASGPLVRVALWLLAVISQNVCPVDTGSSRPGAHVLLLFPCAHVTFFIVVDFPCVLQVISPQQATGIVEVVGGLHELQDKNYTVPTVLLAQQVS